MNLQFGPDGNLYYVDFDGGMIRKIVPANLQSPQSGYLSDLNWTVMTNGWGPVEKDSANGGTGIGDGTTLTLNGVAYAKGLGAHAESDVRYSLAGGCSRFKASIGVDDNVGANGSVTFEVYADTSKIYDSGVMTGTSTTKLVDISVAGASELRLVVTGAGDGVSADHANWALARVECGSAGSDTTPPTITARTPTGGASSVTLDVLPTVTFSEAMDPPTVTTSAFTLVQQGQTTPVPATVSYSGLTATLDPSADLQGGTSYTAIVKGGSSGAKDVAGNALASDVSWTFTTLADTNGRPTPVIDAPASAVTWQVGGVIAFSGYATDAEEGTLPASSLTWTLLLQHCPSNCHTHTVQTGTGVATGSFNAPDHEYRSYLDLRLVATDAGGATGTTSISLDPQSVELTFGSSPSVLQLSVNAASSWTPFNRTVIVGSSNSVSSISPQIQSGTTYQFSSWSDGSAQTHNVTAPAISTTHTATYVIAPPRNTALPAISGQPRVGRSLTLSRGSWSGSQPISFAYQWLRCTSTAITSCVTIPGASSLTYVLTSSDRTRRLRAMVTASNAGGSSSATSLQTSPVK